MSDPFASTAPTKDSCADNWLAITPDDNNDLAEVPKAILVFGAGNIVLVGQNGHAETFPVPNNTALPCRPRRIKETGTTATGIFALY